MADISLTEIVAGRILSLCKERGITVNKLATMSGLRQSTLDGIIKGKTKSPTLATLMRVATGLSITVVDLLNTPEIVTFSIDDKESDLYE